YTPNTKSTFGRINGEGLLAFYNIVESFSCSFIDENNVGAEDKFRTFRDMLVEACLRAFPKRTYCNKERPYIAHWFSDELRKMRDHLSFLGDVCKRCGSPNLAEFKIFRNK
ncbi:hypothetical protein HHI36_010734, partial [Cryptolaemus montrouzieri]